MTHQEWLAKRLEVDAEEERLRAPLRALRDAVDEPLRQAVSRIWDGPDGLQADVAGDCFGLTRMQHGHRSSVHDPAWLTAAQLRWIAQVRETIDAWVAGTLSELPRTLPEVDHAV